MAINTHIKITSTAITKSSTVFKKAAELMFSVSRQSSVVVDFNSIEQPSFEWAVNAGIYILTLDLCADRGQTDA